MAPRHIIFLLFTLAAIPLLEIGLMLRVGQAIGFWWTVAALMGSAALGVLVIRRIGLATAAAMFRPFGGPVAPFSDMLNGGLMVMAGVLLVIPGFVSDALAAVLLIPPVRRLITTSVASMAMDPFSGGRAPRRGKTIRRFKPQQSDSRFVSIRIIGAPQNHKPLDEIEDAIIVDDLSGVAPTRQTPSHRE